MLARSFGPDQHGWCRLRLHVVDMSLGEFVVKVGEIEKKKLRTMMHTFALVIIRMPCSVPTTCSPPLLPPHQSLALLYLPWFVVALIWWLWGHVALSVAFINMGRVRHGWVLMQMGGFDADG